MSEWIKINPYHRPIVGHAIYSNDNHPEDGEGTLYYVTEINDEGFTMESRSNKAGDIPEDERQTIYTTYDSIPKTNFWVWDRHRENNYEIDEIYSN